MLPTCVDVFKAYCYNQTLDEISGSLHDKAKITATAVKEIYEKASIPTVKFNSIVKRVKRLVSKIRELEKYPEAKKSSVTFQEKLSSYSKLFDVCSCKCFDAGIQDRSQCNCPLCCGIVSYFSLF